MELHGSFSPLEIQFYAEDEIVTILPNFKLDQLQLIRDTYGPFKPQLPVDVPLWLAITLKRNKKCKVQPPAWMNVETLQEKLREERASELWQEVPPHFLEMGRQLLQYAADDIPNATAIRQLLQDLYERRLAKITYNLHKLEPDAFLMKMDNLTRLEMNNIRSILNDTMGYFLAMESVEEA